MECAFRRGALWGRCGREEWGDEREMESRVVLRRSVCGLLETDEMNVRGGEGRVKHHKGWATL